MVNAIDTLPSVGSYFWMRTGAPSKNDSSVAALRYSPPEVGVRSLTHVFWIRVRKRSTVALCRFMSGILGAFVGIQRGVGVVWLEENSARTPAL